MKELRRKIEEFAFDEKHGFTEDENGNCELDLSVSELNMLKESGDLFSVIYNSYKLGFMRGKEAE